MRESYGHRSVGSAVGVWALSQLTVKGQTNPEIPRSNLDSGRSRSMSVSPSAPPKPGFEPVLPFGRLSREDLAYAGGKGANLGELSRAGLPVPEGFVIGAPAYADYCEETGLRQRLAGVLDGLDVEDTEALGASSAAARE